MSTPAPGRRVAARRRPRRRPTRGAIAAAALVVVGGILLVAGARVQASPEASPRPTSVPVEEVTAACLGWPTASSGRTSTLAAPLQDTPDAGGGTLSAIAAGGKAAGQPTRARGDLQNLDSPARGQALVVSATGGAAVGRATFQADRANGAGLALQGCVQPRAGWWFTGGGAGLDHRSELLLANVDPGPAVVDVVVQGPDGVAEDVGTRGITLAAGEVRGLDLVEVAPQSDELQVHVEATRGRVVAGLADSFATQPAAQPGPEWVPGQTEAARVLRLLPLPRLADRRTLVLANPSPDREALVEVRVSGRSGSFVPTGLEAVRVPARSVVTADLGEALGRDSSGVVLRSPVPVTATVRSERARDVSYAAAVPMLDGPAAALLEHDADAEVQLAAGAGAARATVTAYSSDGEEVESTVLKVSAHATAAWRLRGGAAYVVVTPVHGLVSGGVSVGGGVGLSQVALRQLPVALEQPAVVPVVR